MRIIGLLGAAWGTAGVVGLLCGAVYRLTPLAVGAFREGLTATQWLIVAAYGVFMLYSEGYRGFQLHFSPRTAARIRYLRDRPALSRTLLAPLFAMGFFHAGRRTKTVAWALTIGVTLLVLLVQALDQPWRGIVDSGVVLGLSWGIVSLVASVYRALTQPEFAVSPEVPGG